jgi:hypothetical protein
MLIYVALIKMNITFEADEKIAWGETKRGRPEKKGAHKNYSCP